MNRETLIFNIFTTIFNTYRNHDAAIEATDQVLGCLFPENDRPDNLDAIIPF